MEIRLVHDHRSYQRTEKPRGVTDIKTYPTRQANRPMLEEMSRVSTMLRRDGKMSQLYPVLLF